MYLVHYNKRWSVHLPMLQCPNGCIKRISSSTESNQCDITWC